MSITTQPDLFSCLLCGGILPSLMDNVFLGHMKEQHRAFINMEFFFAAFFLDQEGMEKTKGFMESLRCGSKVNQNTDDHEDDKVEEHTNIVYGHEIPQKEEQIEEGEIIDIKNKDITDDGSKEINEHCLSNENKKIKATSRCNCNIS